jgi:hypothetical protein
MKGERGRIQRPGRIYHFSVNGVDHAAFIWQLGKQFHGLIEGDPQVPLCTGRTARMVRDALQQWLVVRAAPT